MDLRDYKNSEVEVKINNQMHGIEIRFQNEMTSEQIEQVKDAGFKWSKRQQLWYAYQNDKSIQYINTLKSGYEEAQEKVKQETENTALLVDLIAELREQIRIQNERIKELENTIQEKEIQEEIKKDNIDENIIESSTNEINFANSIVLEEQNSLTEEVVEEEFNQQIDDEESEITLYEEELELCRKVIPPNQYSYTLELAQGEEGNFYKQKLKQIAKIARQITTDEERVNPDGTHNVGFHYFVGNTDIYISEITKDGLYGFGYTILNGDVQMSEWGFQDLEEILKSSPYIEMDYHVEEGMTIERMLEEKYPEYFKQETSIDINNSINEQNNYHVSKYNYFVKDTAEFDHFAEIEPVTNLSAKEAIEKYKELLDKGLSVGIGINIPTDIALNDPEGLGVTIVVKDNDVHTFDIYGDSFIKDLKENDAKLELQLIKNFMKNFKKQV